MARVLQKPLVPLTASASLQSRLGGDPEPLGGDGFHDDGCHQCWTTADPGARARCCERAQKPTASIGAMRSSKPTVSRSRVSVARTTMFYHRSCPNARTMLAVQLAGEQSLVRVLRTEAERDVERMSGRRKELMETVTKAVLTRWRDVRLQCRTA